MPSAGKSLALKQRTPLLLSTIKSTYKLNHCQPATEMLTSQGFPTVETQKAAAIPLTRCRWWEVKSVQKNGYWRKSLKDLPQMYPVMWQLVPDISYNWSFHLPPASSPPFAILRSLHYHLLNGPSWKYPNWLFLRILQPPKSGNFNAIPFSLVPLSHFRFSHFSLDYD